MTNTLPKEQTIPANKISVVIQGPLYRKHPEGDLALQAITSIKAHLPQAEIIISTWKDEDCSHLHADKIITSSKPDGFLDVNGQTNNVARQIVSTKNGILNASREYVLKFRADHVLTNNNMTVIRDYMEEVKTEARLFRQPITVTNLFIRHPLHMPLLFHLSDLIQFGRKEDMLSLWSIKMPEAKDVYLNKTPKLSITGQFIGYTAMRVVPEQYLTLAFLKQHGFDLELQNVCYTDYKLFKLWETLLCQQFKVINWQHTGIVFPKRFLHHFYGKHANYTAEDLISVQRALSTPFYWNRYLRLLLNKYIYCWINYRYLHCLASRILFAISPTFAKWLRGHYRALCGIKS